MLINDHDPKPLHYQFAAEQAGEFSWDYLEQGPESWRVRIGRTGVPVSYPPWYLWRPYVIYRSRRAAHPTEPGTSGRRWGRIGVRY